MAEGLTMLCYLFALGAGTLVTVYGDEENDTILVYGTNGYTYWSGEVYDFQITISYYLHYLQYFLRMDHSS